MNEEHVDAWRTSPDLPQAALLPVEKVLSTAVTTSVSGKKPRHPPPREGF